jgi:YidC/Oxa1 family membrane protein insertase
MDNNRTILAVVLIVLLWSAYSLFFAPQQPVQQPAAVVEKKQEEKATASAQQPAVTEAAAVPAEEGSVAEESTVTVTSDFYDIEISSIGATIKSIDLKQFKAENTQDSAPYSLFKSTDFSLSTLKNSGEDGLYLPANLNYKIVGNNNTVVVSDRDVTVSFSAVANGLTVIKSYIFHADSYSFDIRIDLINGSPAPITGRLNLSLVTHWDKDAKSQMYSFVGPVTYNGKDLEEDKPKDLEKSPKIYKSDVIWSGYTTKYFLNAINPNQPIEQLFVSAGAGFVENRFTSPPINLQQNQKTSFDYTAYFGPKQSEFLVASGHQFDKAIDYGFFHPLAKPLMVVLKFFYGFIGNYGFAVILLTICIKLIFWPLTQKSYKSMKGMQKLQPEMKKMREKYGNDKQKLNQEMMAFYKENKVNPLGGCLPMVIQIPVFFALYRVLLGSIELRHAPFMLWITDLSARDPYYVTPLIMGVTMFIQQKMQPTNMDPTQAKIMLMMPVVFTFMFLNFPSGLVLYWLTNNLLTILQQYLIRRQPD